MNFFKPIMFLDIDGCLATPKQYYMSTQNFWDKNPRAKELKIPYPFDKKCVKILNEIILKTDCEIVLTSDWKHHWSLNELSNVFKFNEALKYPIDCTKNFNISFNFEKNRAYEIENYIEKNKIWSYVIIDDLNLQPYLSDSRFIRARDREGIKQCGMKQKIINIIERR